jgi:2-oxoglutarate ferredoxin oxidoreductase subunit alpha
MRDSLSLALAGSGGAGVMTAGNMLLEAAAAAGVNGLMTRTSGPQIRGGEAAAMLRVAAFPTDAQEDRFHVLAAIDWQNVGRLQTDSARRRQRHHQRPAHGARRKCSSGARYVRCH